MEDFSKYPRYYYKFLKLDYNFIQSLINKELWFSDPLKFNDPYDCRLILDSDNTYEEILDFLIQTNKKYRNPVSNSYIEERALQLSNNPSERKEIAENARKHAERFRITCLSKSKKNILMWSHYADNHAGVCIKLDSKMDVHFFTTPLKVEYSKEYPKFNYIRDRKKGNKSTIKHLIGNKYSSWRYEQEYRIFKSIDETNFRNGGLLGFNEKMLVEINFGIKCSSDKIKTVKKIVEKHYSNNIKLYKAEPTDNSFKLNFVKL